MAKIHATDREGNSRELTAYDGTSLMEVLRDEGMGVEASCGGQCACATCHCYLEDSWFNQVTPPDSDETELLATLEHYDANRSRLSCQIQVSNDLEGLTLTVATEK